MFVCEWIVEVDGFFALGSLVNPLVAVLVGLLEWCDVVHLGDLAYGQDYLLGVYTVWHFVYNNFAGLGVMELFEALIRLFISRQVLDLIQASLTDLRDSWRILTTR